MEYNTARNHLIMREYGRNVQRMIEHILTIEDRDKRQEQVMAVIELMGTLQPHLRNVEDFRHKLWDHLFLVSGFKLDVDSPYPIPTKETLSAKPDRLPYPKKHPRHRHFGKNLERVIEKALDEQNPEKVEGFTQVIGNYMKLAYSNWHKESVHDDAIKAELNGMTKGALQFDASGQPAPAPVNTTSYNVAGSDQSFRTPSTGTKRKAYQQKFKNNNNGNNGNSGLNKGNKHNKYKNRNK
jgi:hypothetical protein